MQADEYPEIWPLLDKKLTGKASIIELKALADITNAHPELHHMVATVSRLWQVRLKKLTETSINRTLRK
jgi:hypothetical protein